MYELRTFFDIDFYAQTLYFKTENNTVCSINTIFYLKYSQLNVLLIKYDVANEYICLQYVENVTFSSYN